MPPDSAGRATPPRIILVDDDELLRESLAQNLVDAGYSVTAFAGGRALLDFLVDGGQGSLIVLDWKMPEMNGIEVLKRLGENGFEIPVLFLTVLSDQIYEEAALLRGAVDFVEKSRSFVILLRRIELILSRDADRAQMLMSEERELRVGDLHLDPATGRAFWRNSRVDLTLTEFKIVHYLASAAGKDIRYRAIYDLVHDEGFIAGAGDHGYRANVRAFIKRIRQKFRDIDPAFEAIETYTGFGYRWVSDPRDRE